MAINPWAVPPERMPPDFSSNPLSHSVLNRVAASVRSCLQNRMCHRPPHRYGASSRHAVRSATGRPRWVHCTQLAPSSAGTVRKKPGPNSPFSVFGTRAISQPSAEKLLTSTHIPSSRHTIAATSRRMGGCLLLALPPPLRGAARLPLVFFCVLRVPDEDFFCVVAMVLPLTLNYSYCIADGSPRHAAACSHGSSSNAFRILSTMVTAPAAQQ